MFERAAKPVKLLWTAVGDALPTARDGHRGLLVLKRASAAEDVLYYGAIDASGDPQLRQLLSKELADTLYGDMLTVKSAGSDVDVTVTTLDFGAGFTLTETPEDEINIAQNFGFVSTTPLAGSYWERTRTAYDGSSKSTSDTANYTSTDMPSINLVMPANGTIEATVWARAGHDAAGAIDLRITIDGNNSTPIPRSAPAVGGMPIYTRHERSVSAGTITVATSFKCNTAGSATISDCLLTVVGHG